MILLGIDIGVTGAISAVDSSGACMVEDLPIAAANGGKTVSARDLIHLIRAMVPPGHHALAVMEDVRVRAMHGRTMSHKTETALVLARGAIEAVLHIARIDVRLVQPQAWKRHFHITGDKTGGKAREIAAGLYPLAADKLRRVKDHNRAESLLIAHYGQHRYA